MTNDHPARPGWSRRGLIAGVGAVAAAMLSTGISSASTGPQKAVAAQEYELLIAVRALAPIDAAESALWPIKESGNDRVVTTSYVKAKAERYDRKLWIGDLAEGVKKAA